MEAARRDEEEEERERKLAGEKMKSNLNATITRLEASMPHAVPRMQGHFRAIGWGLVKICRDAIASG